MYPTGLTSSPMASAESSIPVLRWSAHPAREHRGRALAGVVVIAALAGVTGVLGGHPLWGLAAALFLVLALNRFYLPSAFELDDDGIRARYPLGRERCRWTEVRHLAVGREGGWLSRRVDDRRRRGRGVHVLFGAQREVVLDAIRTRLSSDATTEVVTS